MVERRMVQAILKTGNYWYTAWVNAGQPNLDELLNEKSTINLENEKLENQYKKNEIKGREHVH